jgi:zinc protease
VRRVGGTPLVYLGYHVPPGRPPGLAAVELLASVLADAPGGRLHKRLVERAGGIGFGFAWGSRSRDRCCSVRSSRRTGRRQGASRDVRGDRRAEDQAGHHRGARARPHAVAQRVGARLHRPRAHRRRRCPRRSARRLAACTSSAATRCRQVRLDDLQRVAAERFKIDNRNGRPLPADARTRPRAGPARVDVAALLKDFKGDPGAAQAEAFDATPANLEARTQRFQLASGLKAAVLPKGTRGRVVQAVLRLHVGDEQSLSRPAGDRRTAASLIDKGGAVMRGSRSPISSTDGARACRSATAARTSASRSRPRASTSPMSS